MNILSLCSGIGGLDLGVERSGLGHVRWMVELDEWCRGVLAARWPRAEIFSDVTTYAPPRTSVDVVCGGFPCQPFSVAGKRRGTSDARHLWPHFARIIEACSPRAFIFENVLGLRTSGLRIVLADLAALGFDVEWSDFSAFEAGSNHLRRRIFIAGAHPDRAKLREQPGWLGRACESARAPIAGDAVEALLRADPDGARRLESSRRLAEQRGWSRHAGWSIGSIEALDDGLPDGLVRREAGRARKALGNAVVVRCAEIVARALKSALPEVET